MRGELSARRGRRGKALGYVGAGTVEFVMDATGDVLLPRGQHPAAGRAPCHRDGHRPRPRALQLLVAQGEPLPAEALEARINGHAIEVRLYAEDVAGRVPACYRPVHRFRIRRRGVRVDAGFARRLGGQPHYDPMLAKVIAHGATRAAAARRLRRALRGAQIHGVVTNRDLLVAILADADFLAGRYVRLPSLVRVEAAVIRCGRPWPRWPRRRVAAAASRPAGATSPAHPQQVAYSVDGREVAVAYRFRRDGVEIAVDGEPLTIELVSATPERVVLDVDGVRRAFAVHRTDEAVYVDDPAGSAALGRVPRFPDPNAHTAAGSLLAPMPGAVVRVAAAAGDRVTAGQALVVLEAMKMEHTVAAPLDGVLTALHVQPGDQVESGQALAVVEEAG